MFIFTEARQWLTRRALARARAKLAAIGPLYPDDEGIPHPDIVARWAKALAKVQELEARLKT